MKANMTKTMQAIIDRAATNKSRPNIGVVSSCCGSGAKGGRINHGSRESTALAALVKLGLVEVIAQHKSAIASACHTLWVYDTTYKVKA
jgi:hypothetical protein